MAIPTIADAIPARIIPARIIPATILYPATALGPRDGVGPPPAPCAKPVVPAADRTGGGYRAGKHRSIAITGAPRRGHRRGLVAQRGGGSPNAACYPMMKSGGATPIAGASAIWNT